MRILIPGILGILLYLLALGLQVRGMRQHEPVARPLLLGLVSAAVAAHAVAVGGLLFAPEGLDLGLYNVAALVALAMTALILVLTFLRPLQNLLVLIVPVATLCLAAGMLMDSGFRPLRDPGPGFTTHVLLAILAYAVLGLAVCQAMVMGWQERQLRRHHALAIFGNLPPLQTMERVLFEMIWVGLGLLTLAILSGVAFLDDLFAQQVVHHTFLSLLSWLVFAILLWGHYRLGWRGRTAVRWTLSGFLLLMLAYFGSKLVLEVILNAQRGY